MVSNSDIFGKKGVLEIKFIGRGGLGAKSAGEILATVAFESGFFIQAFPEYGAERTGAPVKSFVRISNKEIRVHTPITNPDVVVLLDPTLIESIDVTEGLSNQGIIIVNSKDENFKQELNNFKGRIFFVDASGIALKTIGKNIPNTPMLGAIAKVIPAFKIDLIKEVIVDEFKTRLSEEAIKKNQDAFEIAYNETKEVKN
ncbi:MAG: 2-oxoacid:acceptor oxidoreductase family protein [Candidatus Woesearchaeota archaeon]